MFKDRNPKSVIAAAMPTTLKRALKAAVYRKYVHSFWSKTANWGDALNPVLIEMLSGRKARFSVDPEMDKFMVVGSILQHADARTVVWGTGFIQKGQKPKETPRAVCAVRGPFSRDQLLRSGIDAPEIYGDPSLLLPHFYNPEVEKCFDVGVVPHYTDKLNPWLHAVRSDPGVAVIDVESGIYEFVRAIKACDLVISSSLHGLICADSYGIPCIWVEFSDQVIGNGFKFYDYFASVKRHVTGPIRVIQDMKLSQVITNLESYRIDIDLDALLQSCPFLSRVG